MCTINVCKSTFNSILKMSRKSLTRLGLNSKIISDLYLYCIFFFFFFSPFLIVVSGVCIPQRSGLRSEKFEGLCSSREMHGEHLSVGQKRTGTGFFKQAVTCPFFNKLFSMT